MKINFYYFSQGSTADGNTQRARQLYNLMNKSSYRGIMQETSFSNPNVGLFERFNPRPTIPQLILGVSGQSIVQPLVSFNLGELGQLTDGEFISIYLDLVDQIKNATSGPTRDDQREGGGGTIRPGGVTPPPLTPGPPLNEIEPPVQSAGFGGIGIALALIAGFFFLNR